MAALHARCFTTPRPWRADEFAETLGMPGTFLLPRPNGLLVGRIILDEAELLTLAVAPEARRQGLGRALLSGFTTALRERGVASAFLEVAADNIAARALYRSENWQQCGVRRRYFGPRTDAIVMRLVL